MLPARSCSFRLRLGLALAALMLLSCNTWTPLPAVRQEAAPAVDGASAHSSASVEAAQPVGLQDGSSETGSSQPEAPLPNPSPTTAALVNVETYGTGEPAGCRSAAEQASLSDASAMLSYAESLLDLARPLSALRLPNSYNAYTGEFAFDPGEAVSISVDDVDNQFLIQNMLNALQAAGFVTWLRRTESQGLHILAIPLTGPGVMQSQWAPYVRSYWSSRRSLPSGDPDVLPALKLPPCAWMVEAGFAPSVDGSWWAEDLQAWPDYAAAAAPFLAPTDADARRVAGEINWLGDRFPEGPDTMCGPLAWSILYRAGAFPPGWGGWSLGAKEFWLAKPSKNGRPWSLFPKASYITHKFSTPLGKFDFGAFPLYPGDFLYMYSEKDGFDHMLVVTEADGAGNVYAVSNIVKVEPERQTTIERVLLLNIYDPSAGIARKEWALDKINGRTGHAGFEVFRWTWMEKDITGQAAVYPVQPGDTYGLIAARWKTPAESIAVYNGDRIDSSLSVGQVVRIPPNPIH